MDADSWANWIALGALLVSAAAFIRGELARRSAADQARKAEEAASTANAASERSATALEKMSDQWAESLSRSEKRDQRQWSGGFGSQPREPRGVDDEDHLLDEADHLLDQLNAGPWGGPMPTRPTEPVVHWTVDKITGRRHMLKNLGRATAYDVELRSDNAVRFNAPGPRNIQMGEAVEFLAIGSMQTGTPELVVTWSDEPDGERQEWRRPLP